MSTELPAHERYVFKPFLGSSHHWAMGLLQNFVSSRNAPEIAILDVGCGSGSIGAYLKNLGVVKLSAIEHDNAAIAACANIYSDIYRNLDSLRGSKFDCVLLLDVLEHMPEPDNFLQELLGYLNPGGVLLISLPNIAHWSVRLSLLFGKFNYQDRGILDRTHLHFYTRKSAIELVKKYKNFEILECRASIEPIELLLPEKIYKNSLFELLSKMRIGLANALPGFFAFQNLIYVRNN